MDRIFQVFVSSTFEDLKDERSQVSNALAKAGYIAAGMELFPASDQQQLEYIERIINRSDYYVVLVGGRYGSLAENGFSFTENEFNFARSQGIPVLAFLPAQPDKIAVGKAETEPSKREMLDAFKAKLKTGRIVEHWSSADDLCLKVVTAVAHAMNLRPRAGWIRGDQAVDPKVLQDLERLRSENDDLRAKLARDDLHFDPNLVGPDDTVSLGYRVSRRMAGQKPEHKDYSTELSLGAVYAWAYEPMLKDSRESEIAETLAVRLAHDQGNNGAEAYYALDKDARKMLRRQFEALDLMTVTTSRGDFEDSEFNWNATQKGRRFAAMKLALQKPIDRSSV